MNKNFFIGILITASLSLTSICSFAEAPEAAPPIQLNQRTLFYEGTLPVTVNGRTLVPVNKFFNFAGIRANYYENENKIIIDSKDNKKRIALFIDDPIMQVYTYTTILQADRNDIVLDAAPILIDETPMCPLRAVLEELGYEVVWDEGAFSITVNTVTLPENTDELPSLTLYTEASDVNKGDIVELYVLLSRYESFKEEYTLSAVTSTVTYDKNEFEFISEEFVPDKPETIGINAVNQDFNGYAAKGVAVIMNHPLEGDNIKCVKLSFKALSDNGGTFALSDRLNVLRGHDNGVIFRSNDAKSLSLDSASTLFLDTTPIVLN